MNKQSHFHVHRMFHTVEVPKTAPECKTKMNNIRLL